MNQFKKTVLTFFLIIPFILFFILYFYKPNSVLFFDFFIISWVLPAVGYWLIVKKTFIKLLFLPLIILLSRLICGGVISCVPAGDIFKVYRIFTESILIVFFLVSLVYLIFMGVKIVKDKKKI